MLYTHIHLHYAVNRRTKRREVCELSNKGMYFRMSENSGQEIAFIMSLVLFGIRMLRGDIIFSGCQLFTVTQHKRYRYSRLYEDV